MQTKIGINVSGAWINTTTLGTHSFECDDAFNKGHKIRNECAGYMVAFTEGSF